MDYFKDILKASQRIKPFVKETRVVNSENIDRMFNANVFFKCENEQEAGAFKFRGATNAVQNLSEKQAIRGVATHSSGNHAAALALAARNRGIEAYIVMPENAPQIKIERVKKYKGRITFCKPTLEARETGLKEIIRSTGATFIPPYDYYDVICGQGTAALEMIEQSGPFDIVMTPVGGGGLLSGTAIATKHLLSKALVIAGEPANADDACQSLRSGKIVPSVDPDTIADGLKTSLGQMNFEIIRSHVDDIYTVSEHSIRVAMVLLREKAGIFAEPSSAVPLAAMIENPEFFKSRKIGMIISGGNISEETYKELTKDVDSIENMI